LVERNVWDESLFQRYLLEMIDSVCARLSSEEAKAIRAEAMAIVRRGELDACRDAAPYAGVPEALRELTQRGYRLGIFTRNARECCERILSRHPLPHSVLLTRDDVDRVKPDPEHLRQVLLRLNCAPEHALVVGDHFTDVETARAAGALAVGVLTTNGTPERFHEAGALRVIGSVADLPRHLPEHPA
jgi:phosphoglycolate phosphatase